MPFSRREPEFLEPASLDAALRDIGVRLRRAGGAAETVEADIERTLVSGARAALPLDFRLLGLLVAWLEVHHKHVNVPKLLRLARADVRPIARAWWSAVGAWLGRQDARWKALTTLYRGEPLDLDDPEVTVLQLRRVGADARFAGTTLRVAQKLLRARHSDVEDPVLLASRHRLYRKRVEFGANYRADVWAALDGQPDATAAEVARKVGCAYETARAVAEDWHLARAAARAGAAA
jgi:hypothetical protein